MKINPDSLNMILSIIGPIGTLLTVVLVFLTLKEMEKQRRESYKPVIVIPQFDLKAKGRVHDKVFTFYSLYRGAIFEEVQIGDSNKPEKNVVFKGAHVILRNLGVGAAKNIVIEWKLDFDLIEAINRIKEFFYKNSVPIVLEVKKGELYVSEKFTPESSHPSTYTIEPQVKNIDYLLPQVVEPLGTHIQFPKIYEKLVCLLATIYENQQPEWLVPDLPLILKISYQDIGNKQYKNQFRLRMTRYLHLRQANKEVPDFFVVFEITQIH